MSTSTVHKTKEYDKFSLHKFNRNINEGLVKRLMSSIEDLGFIHGKAIIVDKDFSIIDGQHRFEACKRLGLPIYYMITKSDPQKTMIQLNAQQVQWKMSDYINSWAANGVKCYQQLQEFEKEHHFGITNSLLILFDNHFDAVDIKQIKAGKPFKLNPNADAIMQFLKDCKDVPYCKSSYFIKAVTRLFRLAEAKHIEKLKKHIISLPQQATAAAYMVAFENIINKGVSGKNRISFKGAGS